MRATTVAAGTTYALGVLTSGLLRPRLNDPTGFLELAEEFAPWWFAPAPIAVAAGLALGSMSLTSAGLALGAGFGATWGRRLVASPLVPETSEPSLTIMTLNALFSNLDHERVAAAIAAEAPDIVALQEVTAGAADILLAILGEQYPYHALRPAPTPAGIGLLSRFPLRDIEIFHLGHKGNWSQRMVVETPIGSITLFNVHPHVPVLRRSRCGIGPIRLPIRFDAERRHRDVRRLVTLLDGADGPLLVLGDFNMSEHSADYRLVSTRLADAFVEVARGFGHTFPRVGALPRNLPVPWPMLRLDYVWHSPELRPLSARVGPSGGSDHHSVVVRLTRAR